MRRLLRIFFHNFFHDFDALLCFAKLVFRSLDLGAKSDSMIGCGRVLLLEGHYLFVLL